MIFQYDKCRITRVYSPKAINVKTADDRKRTRQRQASAYSDGRWSRQEPAMRQVRLSHSHKEYKICKGITAETLI